MSSTRVDVVSDVLVLAAIDRAECHSGRDARGVPIWAVLGHLDTATRTKRAREVRDRLEALEVAGALECGRRHGVPVWVLTGRGRRRLSRARRAGRLPVLPESPQHRAWRLARGLAEQRIGEFRLGILEAAEHAQELLDVPASGLPVLDAPGAVPGSCSDEWLEVGEQLQRACRRLASASYCLWEWREPDDARADIDDLSGPCDGAFDAERRAERRARRWGRRNTLLWDARPALVFLGRAIREQREQQDIMVAELAGKAGISKRRLQRLEAGKVDPDFELWAGLAAALNVKPSALAVRAGELEATEGPR
jgi:DNA-binding XRE family transcriptional regulator